MKNAVVLITILSALAVVSLTACGATKTALDDTEWVLESYGEQGHLQAVLEGTEITASFNGAEGQVTGSAGCNSYSANYEAEHDVLVISQIAMTEMACLEPEGIMEQEAEYLAALENVSMYRFEDQQRLILQDSDDSRMVDYIPARTFELTETVWFLESFNNGNYGIVSVLEGSEITAVFNDEGQVSGLAGCNNYSGAYQVDGEMISIELGPLTMMFCEQPEGVMDQETAYLQALDSVSSYRILGDELVMQNEAGQEVLMFRASDLVGYVWMWVEFLENNDTVTHPNMPANYTVEFMPDGQVAIQADCNQAGGSYTFNGSQIDIEIGPTTLAACPEDSLSDEYLRLLNDAVIYFRQADFLFLDIMMDAGTMKFFPME